MNPEDDEILRRKKAIEASKAEEKKLQEQNEHEKAEHQKESKQKDLKDKINSADALDLETPDLLLQKRERRMRIIRRHLMKAKQEKIRRSRPLRQRS